MILQWTTTSMCFRSPVLGSINAKNRQYASYTLKMSLRMVQYAVVADYTTPRSNLLNAGERWLSSSQIGKTCLCVLSLSNVYIYTSEAAILSSRELPRFWMTMMWFLCLRTRHWSCEIRTPFCYSINEKNCDNHIISLFILLIPWKRWAFSVQHSRGPTDDSQAEAIRLGKALGQFISELYQSPEASFDRQVCRLDNVVFRDY